MANVGSAKYSEQSDLRQLSLEKGRTICSYVIAPYIIDIYINPYLYLYFDL
jgi:hypothetical protein